VSHQQSSALVAIRDLCVGLVAVLFGLIHLVTKNADGATPSLLILFVRADQIVFQADGLAQQERQLSLDVHFPT
jgi:hypothetical protein